MSSPSPTASAAQKSNEEFVVEFFASLCRLAAEPNAPPPYLPRQTPQIMLSHIREVYIQKIKGPVTTVLTRDGQLTFEPSSSFTPTVSMPTTANPASVSPADTRDRKSKAKVPRPANAFILYRQHQHPLIKAQFSGIVNNDICKTVPLTEF